MNVITVSREITTTEVVSTVTEEDLIKRVGEALHIHICGRTNDPTIDLFRDHLVVAEAILRSSLLIP